MTRNPPPGRRGRGAPDNPTGRFERHIRAPFDDGWWLPPDDEALPTTVAEDTARTVIARNSSPDIPFDRSINPYRGCEHGCIYCFARPNHAFLGLSPGLDFETRLFAKTDAPRLLERELSKPSYRPRTIMLGADTDPYQPIERERRIARAILEVLARFRHPVAIATKSALVCRDLDILREMAGRRLVSVGVSVTTLDRALARRMEPRAATPARRLRAIAALSAAGVPVSVLAAPMIPQLNDHELERILEAAVAAGATGAAYTLLRLPHELKALFAGWLAEHAPDRAARVLARLRECRDGRLYASDFGSRMRGTGPYAELLARRFAVACGRLGLETGTTATRPLDVGQFRVPDAPGPQLRLL